jgi:uncharacterized integral membrane protein
METVIIPLAIVYIILLVFGFKSTWRLAVNGVLAGSSGIIFPIILYILMILVVGPIMGIITIVKQIIAKRRKIENEQK